MIFIGTWHLGFVVVTLVLDDCSCALNLQDWISVREVPAAFFHTSTENVLRCGKLCERQGICVGATFDHQKSICYMHSSDVTSFVLNTNGRYMYKNYREKKLNYVSGSACDKETQIVLPSAVSGATNCNTMEGLIGKSCRNSYDCSANNSECGNGYCNCKVGYSFSQRTQLCYKDCSSYGNTFQPFNGKYVSGYNTYKFPDKTASECAQLCIEYRASACKGYEDDRANNLCYLHPYHIKATSFGTSPTVDYYQRNCE